MGRDPVAPDGVPSILLVDNYDSFTWNLAQYLEELGARVDVRYNDRFDPTHTVRLGAEYVFIPERPEEILNRLWTVRGGLFFDQEPATDKTDDFYGFAVGCGLLAYHRVNIDVAYQLRYGHHVNEDFFRGIEGFNEDVFQHRVLLSTVIYF